VSNLVKISEVQVLDEIPVLWTGKIDYKELKKLISFHENIERKTYNFSNIDETLKKKVSELSGESLSKIKKESIFGKDIILDSIDVWELMIFIRKHYKIEWEIEVQKIKKYADLEALVNKRKNI
jgi:acyl carrier protein